MGNGQHAIDQIIGRHFPQVGRSRAAETDVVMGQHHTLGIARRSGGIEQYRHVGEIRIGIAGARRRDMQLAKRPFYFGRPQPFGMGGRIGRGVAGHEDSGGRCVIKDAAHFRFGLARVDRYDRRPDLPCREECGNRGRAVLRKHQDAIVFGDTRIAQALRQIVRGAVQIPVGPFHAGAVAQRGRVAPLGHLPCQKFLYPCHARSSLMRSRRSPFRGRQSP